MKKTIALFLLSSFSLLSSAQTNFEKFNTLFQKKSDSAKVRSLLTRWEKSNPNDPEFYTCAYNFHFSASKEEILVIGKDEPNNESYQLTDSAGKVAGFLSSTLQYNSNSQKKAFEYINAGIERFPNRLDMRFGKTYALGLIADYKNFTEEIIRTLEYSKIVNNNWLWTENKKIEDAENFLTDAVHSYMRQLYDTEDDSLLENINRIGETTIKYYPNHVEILSTTAVANMLKKNYDKAIEYLKMAEKIDPKDFIVLNNIARGYSLKGDKLNAIKYYKLTEKHGDKQAKVEAKKEIEQLNK